MPEKNAYPYKTMDLVLHNILSDLHKLQGVIDAVIQEHPEKRDDKSSLIGHWRHWAASARLNISLILDSAEFNEGIARELESIRKEGQG